MRSGIELQHSTRSPIGRLHDSHTFLLPVPLFPSAEMGTSASPKRSFNAFLNREIVASSNVRTMHGTYQGHAPVNSDRVRRTMAR